MNQPDAKTMPETDETETRLVVELPTEITAGMEPVCRMCCNGPHSGPPPRNPK